MNSIDTLVYYKTPAGIAQLRQRLSAKLDEYGAICAERATAHAVAGDGWHDNPSFNRLQQLEAEKTREIAALQQILDRSRLVNVDQRHRPTDRVRIGSLVSIQIEEASGDERQVTWEIAGYDETDVPGGRLGYNTPLAAALMGELPGAEVTATLPRGPVWISIIKLHDVHPTEVKR